jgi:DNA-binding transcriptional ArsR family regulator
MGFAAPPSIYYRRWTMNTEPRVEQPVLDRTTAAQYAAWFKSLADPTRVQIVTLPARRRAPMTVGEITSAVRVGQSTVSHHLKALAEVRFVLVEHVGTTSLYRINEACVACFPSAADVIMGRPVPSLDRPLDQPQGAADATDQC